MNGITHLSLFTGIGGIDLAAEWAGFHTIGQVEQNPYANRVLRKRFGRKIPRWTDIRDLSAKDVRRRTGIDSPTLISGGFPCQPFSCAGKRQGKEDDRYLWPEMFRVVRELRPAWVLGENAAGIVNMELESCCADLEGEGYTVRAFLIPACGVGAWHRRDRVFIVGCNTDRIGKQTRTINGETLIMQDTIPNTNCTAKTRQRQHGRTLLFTREKGLGKRCNSGIANGSKRQLHSANVANPDVQRLQGLRGFDYKRNDPGQWTSWAGSRPPTGIWESEPAVGRVAHGIPHRVDRLRCLGNAVVPQQVYPILAGIAQIENSVQE